jgi:hypothetical protein
MIDFVQCLWIPRLQQRRTRKKVLLNSEKIDNNRFWQSSYREVNNKGRPFPDFGFDSNQAIMPLDDGVTYRKAEP